MRARITPRYVLRLSIEIMWGEFGSRTTAASGGIVDSLGGQDFDLGLFFFFGCCRS